MLMSTAEWEEYKKSINDIHNDFNQTPIIWRRKLSNFNRFGEDPSGDGGQYTDVNLSVLILSNYFRTWPINKPELTGEDDKQNLTIILNYKYLRDLGYTTQQGYFNFNPGLDRFIIKGRVYKPFGDTDVAYANNEPLLFYITCERDANMSGEPINP